MRIYPYRTTTEQLEKNAADVAGCGDTVLSQHFVGGRDWVLICRHGDPRLGDLTVVELEWVVEQAARSFLTALMDQQGAVDRFAAVVAKAVEQAVQRGTMRGAREGTQRREGGRS